MIMKSALLAGASNFKEKTSTGLDGLVNAKIVGDFSTRVEHSIKLLHFA
ncbi:hypothetical protein [Gimesia aquarii]|nr:hypothetical protein [Gimesia aquarii]